MASWTSVSISVSDMDAVLDLWSNTFGLEVREQKNGEDSELASLWDLAPVDFERQALLGTPGMDQGLIHFVQFREPGPAVRDGAQVFDLCPKNLDVYVHDMPARFEELKAKGWKFRTESYSEVTAPDGTMFREVHMHGHDSINIVLLEVIGLDLPFTKQGYAGAGPLITIVADAPVERSFYKNIIGLQILHDNILEGPEIERMIGLPPGSALDVSIWGGVGEALGQMEIIEYRGVSGNNLYPLAKPKQRGILHVTYNTDDMAEFKRLLDAQKIDYDTGGHRSILPGNGSFIRLLSPAGFRIEVFEN